MLCGLPLALAELWNALAEERAGLGLRSMKRLCLPVLLWRWAIASLRSRPIGAIYPIKPLKS